MIDDLVELAVAASADILINKAAKRRRWVRILSAIGGLSFIAVVIAAIYATFKYS